MSTQTVTLHSAPPTTSRPRLLVSDPLPEEIVGNLRAAAEVTVKTGMNPSQLAQEVPGFDALVVRSQSKVTKEVIEAGSSLKIIGRAGVGVDNIDVEAATAKGIVVVNSPDGNTISAAEHTMAMLLATARHIPQARASMQQGQWDRKSFTGVELFDKTLGVVGFGRIGREVASRCAAFQMRVLAYDPFVSAEFIADKGAVPASLDEIYAQADFITLHLPKTPETSNLIGEAALAKMKKSAILVNCARGGIVDEAALFEALKSGQLAAAGLDVFENEPLGPSPLLSLPNVVTTPHLAASTVEAQERVAIDVAAQVLDVLRGGAPRAAVNIPYVPPEEMGLLRPFLHLVERMGCFVAALCEEAVEKVHVRYFGEISQCNVNYLTKAVLKGLLSVVLPDTVNFVNAVVKAQERGITVQESRCADCHTYSSLVEIVVEGRNHKHQVSGTLFSDRDGRVIDMDGFPVTIELSGPKLITWQTDCPGVVGKVGTILGQHDINIAEMQLGRKQARTKAVMVMSVDEIPSSTVMAAVANLAGIEKTRLVQL